MHVVDALQRSGTGLALGSTQSIGPAGSNVAHDHRPTNEGPSAVLHRRDVPETVGGWRDYRTIVVPPDIEFIERVVGRYGLAHSRALTVCKFNSAWRRDSYLTRRDDEQRLYVERILRERTLVERELLAFFWLRIRRAPQSLPAFDPVPDVVPPGWHVTQYRRVRASPTSLRGEEEVKSVTVEASAAYNEVMRFGRRSDVPRLLPVLAALQLGGTADSSAGDASARAKAGRLVAFGSCGNLLDYAKSQATPLVGPYGLRRQDAVVGLGAAAAGQAREPRRLGASDATSSRERASTTPARTSRKRASTSPTW